VLAVGVFVMRESRGFSPSVFLSMGERAQQGLQSAQCDPVAVQYRPLAFPAQISAGMSAVQSLHESLNYCQDFCNQTACVCAELGQEERSRGLQRQAAGEEG